MTCSYCAFRPHYQSGRAAERGRARGREQERGDDGGCGGGGGARIQTVPLFRSMTGLMRGYGGLHALDGVIKITDGRKRITPHSHIVTLKPVLLVYLHIAVTYCWQSVHYHNVA